MLQAMEIRTFLLRVARGDSQAYQFIVNPSSYLLRRTPFIKQKNLLSIQLSTLGFNQARTSRAAAAGRRG